MEWHINSLRRALRTVRAEPIGWRLPRPRTRHRSTSFKSRDSSSACGGRTRIIVSTAKPSLSRSSSTEARSLWIKRWRDVHLRTRRKKDARGTAMRAQVTVPRAVATGCRIDFRHISIATPQFDRGCQSAVPDAIDARPVRGRINTNATRSLPLAVLLSAHKLGYREW